MNKLGLHISSGNRRGFGEFLQRCAAASRPIPVIFSLDQDIMPDVIKYSPGTIVVFRHQPTNPDGGPGLDGPGDMYHGNPQASARNWMNRLLPIWRLNPAHYYAPLNEQQPATLEQFKWLADFTIECQAMAEAASVKLALFAFSAGTPKDETNPAIGEPFIAEQSWAELIPALRVAQLRGDILLLHEYGFNSPAANDGASGTLRASAPAGLALRYRRVYKFLHSQAIKIPLVVSEASSGMGFTGNINEWVSDLIWYADELARDRAVIGCCGYQLGGAENCMDALPALGDAIVSAPDRDWEGDPVVGLDTTPPPTDPRDEPIVSIVHLLPPDATIREVIRVQQIADSNKQDVLRSAHNARRLIKQGLPGSRAIIWEPQRWPGETDIITWLDVPTETRYFNAPPTEVKHLEVPYLSQLNVPNADYAPGDCGSADIAMWLNFIGRTVTVDEVSAATGRPAGFTLLTMAELMTAANAFGLKLRHALDRTVTELKAEIDAGRPALVLVNYALLPPTNQYDATYKHGHYLLIVGYAGDTLIYHDPYFRNEDGAFKSIRADVFDRAWSTPNADFTYIRQALLFDTMPPPPATGNAWRGLHMRADGHSGWLDFECLKVGKLNAAKIMTNTGFDELAYLIALGIAPDHIVLRLFADFSNRVVLPNEFVEWQRLWLTEFARVGGRYIEIHNEPNLPVEGLGQSWQNAASFAGWYGSAVNLIRANWPQLKCGYPGLSPSGGLLDPRGEPALWIQTLPSLIAQGKVDWIAVHCYWANAAGMIDVENGRYYERFLGFGKPLMITEFSNNIGVDTHAAKGQQYKAYYASLPKQVLGAFAFVSSASDKVYNLRRETWAMSGAPTDIPREVGK